MQAKYPEDYFRIPYIPSFMNRYVLKTNPPQSNREYSLTLVDKISELPAHLFRNKVIFPALPDTNITFLILSQAFYLHKAKILLKRISRTGFTMATCGSDWAAQFDKFARKKVDIPISSAETFIMCSTDFGKFYSIKEMVNDPILTSQGGYSTHSDVVALRTICPITNLSHLRHLKVLHHPYMFNSFNNKSESKQVDEVRALLEGSDQLEEF